MGDGMFWMTWDDFRNRFSDVGVVPKQMAVPKLGSVEGMVQGSTGAKHDKKFKSTGGGQPVPAANATANAPDAATVHGGPSVCAAFPDGVRSSSSVRCSCHVCCPCKLCSANLRGTGHLRCSYDLCSTYS